MGPHNLVDSVESSLAVQHIIAALVEDWDRVYRLLDEQARAVLRQYVTSMAEAQTPRQRTTSANKVVQLLMSHVPEDPVLDVKGRRFGRAAQPADIDSALILLSRTLHSRTAGGGARTADERILANRWETAHALRRRGVDPDIPDLIRLDRADGSRAVPTFQFDEHGAPIPVVLRVNQVLGAYDDPWGVADWWLSTNVWLHEPPFALVGRTPDHLLVAAAVTAVEG
jgi:hypothetical protein